nr:TetR/AcrR family transcriptional regulator [Parafrankia sp. EUN1f]
MTDSDSRATPRRTRAEQRQQTEGRILSAARELFAEHGYDRTTIRAVAARANVDAGLVMHYFHSKDGLFTRAAKLPPDDLPDGAPSEVAEALLASLGKRLEAEPVASLAVLRSILTHSEAAEGFRAAGRRRVDQIKTAIPVGDAELRAGLISAIIHGVVAERYLLRTSVLADASPDEIVNLLRPCFQVLVGLSATSGGPVDAPHG